MANTKRNFFVDSSPHRIHQTRFTSRAGAKRNHIEPRTLPNCVSDEIRRNYVDRKAKKLKEREKLISQVMKRREWKRSPNNSERSTKGSEIKEKHSPFESPRQHKLLLGNNSSGTINTEPVIHESNNKRPESKTSLQSTSLVGEVQANRQLLSDYKDCKVECARLRTQANELQTKLHNKDMKTSLLHQQEIETLRMQLTKWQMKSKKLSKIQRKERKNLEKSTDLISEARIGLTKTLNDASKLEAKIFDLETAVHERDRRVEDLYDTIERQSRMIRDMMVRKNDTETILCLNENEKRKLEDEVQVLIATKNGEDLAETFRMLERAREKWLSDREKKIEAARIEMMHQTTRILERQRDRYRQEQEILLENSNKKKRLDEKQLQISKFINQQLDYMMEVNRGLRQKLAKERDKMKFEIQEHGNFIATLEPQSKDLNKQVASRNQSEEKLMFREGDTDYLDDNIRGARKKTTFSTEETHCDQIKQVKRLQQTPSKASQGSLDQSPSRFKKQKLKIQTKNEERSNGSEIQFVENKTKQCKKGKSKKKKDKAKKKKLCEAIRNSQSNKVTSPAQFHTNTDETLSNDRKQDVPQSILLSPIQ